MFVATPPSFDAVATLLAEAEHTNKSVIATTGTRRPKDYGVTGLAPRSPSIAKQLQTVPIGAFVTLDRLERGGSLQARRLTSGALQFCWRYSHEGRTHREPVGAYDALSPPKKLEPTSRGFNVAAARERCRLLSLKHAEHIGAGGLREAKIIERKQRAATEAAATARALHSLARLLDDYVSHQFKQGRISVREAKCIFDLHVVAAWPTLAEAPAADLSQDQVVDMLRRLTEQGKGRTSNKLRTYLRAAYQCAIDVRVTASIPVAFKAYEVQTNPQWRRRAAMRASTGPTSVR